VLLIAGLRVLPRGGAEPDRRPGLDLAGVATLTPAVLALVLPLVLGQSEHWPVWGWASLAASAVLFASFVAVERQVARSGGSPLIPGRVVRLPGVAAGVAALFTVMAVFGGLFFVLALHLQGGLADSPLRAGLTFAPAALAFALVSLNWQRVPARAHHALICGGFASYGVALLIVGALLAGGATGSVWIYLALSLTGAGMAAAFSPLMTSVIVRVPVADAGEATGVLVTANQLALVVGVATFGTLYLNIAGKLPAHPGLAAHAGLAAQAGLAGFRLDSAHALAVTCLALAAAAVVGGALATARALRARHNPR
jgi:hypothetical protein